GYPDDIPVSGDYDGDKLRDVAVWRPSTGELWIINSSKAVVTTQFDDYDSFAFGWEAVTRKQWGQSGDVPVPADYDGDGRTDFAILQNGEWKIVNSSTGNVTTTGWCCNGERPVAGDYDHDGRVDPAEWRSDLGYGQWLVKLNSTGSYTGPYAWGMPGDVPIKPGPMFR